MPKPSSVSSSEKSMRPAKPEGERRGERGKGSEGGKPARSTARQLLTSTLGGLFKATKWPDYADKLKTVTSSKSNWSDGQRRWVFEELSKARKTAFGDSGLPISIPACEISGVNDSNFSATKQSVEDLVSWVESNKDTIDAVKGPGRKMLKSWVDKWIESTFDGSQKSKSRRRRSTAADGTVTNPTKGSPRTSDADGTVTNGGESRKNRRSSGTETDPPDELKKRPKESSASKLKDFLPSFQKSIGWDSILPTISDLSNIDINDTDQVGYTLDRLEKLHPRIFGKKARFSKEAIEFDESKVSSEFKDSFNKFESWATENTDKLRKADAASNGHISRMVRGLIHEKVNPKTSRAFESNRKAKRAARYAIGQEMAKESNETNGAGTEESNKLTATLASELGHMADATAPDTSQDDAVTKEIRNTDYTSMEHSIGGVWDKLEKHLATQRFKWGTDPSGKKCAIRTVTTQDGDKTFKRMEVVGTDGTLTAINREFTPIKADPITGEVRPIFVVNVNDLPQQTGPQPQSTAPTSTPSLSRPATTFTPSSNDGFLSTVAKTASKALGSWMPSRSLITTN